MKRLFLASILTSLSLVAFGAAAGSSSSIASGKAANAHFSTSSLPIDPALLGRLAARSKTIDSLEGHFVQQKHIAVLPVPLKSTGKFEFRQAKGVLWETLTPIRSTVNLTPTGISFADDQGRVQTAQQAGIEVIAKIFTGVITGELEGLNNYFVVTAMGTDKQWQLSLSPRSANLAAYIRAIELHGGEFTEELTIAETNGDQTHIEFTTDKVVRKAP